MCYFSVLTAFPFEVTSKGFNEHKTIDYTKVPLALVTRFKWDSNARLLPMVAPMLVHRTWSIQIELITRLLPMEKT